MHSMSVFCAIFCLTVLVSGCASAPELPDETRISISSIVKRVRCEVYEATVYYNPAFTGQNNLTGDQSINKFVNSLAIGFTLTLQVKETDGVNTNAATSAWGIPITFGLFSFKASAGLNGVARRTGTYNVSMLVREMWKDGGKDCGTTETNRAATVELDGRFGIDEWLTRAIQTTRETGATKSFVSTGTTIEYFLTPSVGLTPTWAIVRPGNRKYDATFPIGWQREYNNKIDIAITSKSDETPKILRVCVENLPPNSKCPDTLAPLPRAATGVAPLTGGVDPETQRRLDNELNNLKIQGLRLLPQ